jgi:putative redox protein
MKVQLKRIAEPYHFQIENETGHSLQVDASDKIGGNNKGFRPTELVLAGLAGCASIDVLLILKKQKQAVSDVKVVVNAERKEEVPSLFKTIHIHFSIYGEASREKIEKAIDLALDKYCTVAKILEPTSEIRSSFDKCGK